MSWELVRMQDIFDISRGGSPRPINDYLTDQENGVNWIMIGDTKGGGKYISKTAKKIKPEGVKKSRFVKEGDFLLTNSMSFGRPYILKTSGCIHDGWLVLSPVNENIHTDYFYYYLGSKEIKIILASKAAGAVVKNLNKDIVKNLKIPLPPLDQQKKIAAILDAADAYRQKTKALITKYEELTQSLFLDMFGDPVSNPMGWEKSKADNHIDLLTGFAFKSKDYSKSSQDLKLCGGLIIMPWGIDWNKCNKWSPKNTKGLDKYWLNEGDIVMAMDRPWISSGFKINMLTSADLPSLLVQRTARIRSKSINIFFLYFLYNSKSFERQAKPTETTVPHISPKDIRNFQIPVPPIELQNQFADRVQAIEVQKMQAQGSLVQAEDLFNSLLQRAFKGELV
jgi:type I restriction enzyme S subunit